MRIMPYRNYPARHLSLMNDMMEDFFRTDFPQPAGGHRSFRVDLEKDENQYIITAELPGLSKEDVNLEVEEGVVTIGVHKEEKKEDEDKASHYLHRERRVIDATRRINLGNVDEENITASMENGILRITLPVAQEVSTKKAIAIQ